MSLTIPTPVFFISVDLGGSSHPIKNGAICDVYTHMAHHVPRYTIINSAEIVAENVEFELEENTPEEEIQAWVDNYYQSLENNFSFFNSQEEAETAIAAGFTIDAAAASISP